MLTPISLPQADKGLWSLGVSSRPDLPTSRLLSAHVLPHHQRQTPTSRELDLRPLFLEGRATVIPALFQLAADRLPASLIPAYKCYSPDYQVRVGAITEVVSQTKRTVDNVLSALYLSGKRRARGTKERTGDLFLALTTDLAAGDHRLALLVVGFRRTDLRHHVGKGKCFKGQTLALIS